MLDHRITLDRVFHALADPTRRGILERLSRSEASVSELARPLEISLAAVVQHIQILEESGVILTRKKGRVRTCRLSPQALDLAEAWIKQRRALWEHRFDQLGELLGEPMRGSSERRTKQ
ncbi:MAG TPA: metalloregulator ArsR/SmtB family transcription factor [Alphaproteobacteria bacterium]|nr:metalloregulator ArsR/SmtB family transcription factor [Alphaproteobacteria bacterium]